MGRFLGVVVWPLDCAFRIDLCKRYQILEENAVGEGSLVVQSYHLPAGSLDEPLGLVGHDSCLVASGHG